MMKIFSILVSLILLLNSVESLSNFIRGRTFNNKRPIKNNFLYDFPTNWYNQRLDHFNEAFTATWNQRYWVNEQFFDHSNGPVFIMIGGEGEENPIWMNNGAWTDYAKKYNALLVMLEHRYYGKSRPTTDLSTENLQYLSSEQALADLASFRNFIHTSYNLTDQNRWISFGGSYPGSLSAWFRLKYPHLVYAAVSSSAPMFAVIDFSDYMVVVNNSLSLYSPKCTQEIQKATKQVQNLIQTDSGRAVLAKLFRTCDPIKTSDDIVNFYAAISGNFEGAVQYNKDNRGFEGAIDTNVTIDLLCDTMLSTNTSDPLRRYAAVNDIILDTYDQKCLDASYDSFLKQMRQTSWNESAAVGGRQWTYQTCVEFGYFQSTSSTKQPFGPTVPVEFYIQQCNDIFGPGFNLTLLQDSVKNTNINYGGYSFEGSRVVFVNGQIDPWHALGFYGNPPNEWTYTIFIEGTAHCADMYPSSDSDLPGLRKAREQISNLIGNWLKQ